MLPDFLPTAFVAPVSNVVASAMLAQVQSGLVTTNSRGAVVFAPAEGWAVKVIESPAGETVTPDIAMSEPRLAVAFCWIPTP